VNADELRVVWTDELARKVHPRRGEPSNLPASPRRKRASASEVDAQRFLSPTAATKPPAPRAFTSTAPSPKFFGALRRLLANADDDVYRAAREQAGIARASATMAGRVGIAFAFPEERAWSEDAARECLASAPWLGAPLLASLDDLDACAALLEHTAAQPELESYLLSLAHALGPPACELLAGSLPALRRNNATLACARALSVFRGRRTAEIFATLLDDRHVRAMAARWLSSEPELALQVLPRVATSRKRAAYLAQAMLESLRRRAATGAATAPPPVAPDAPTDLTADAHDEAPLEALPPAVAHPPWRAKQREPARPAILLDPPDLPETIVWDAGGREEHARVAQSMIEARQRTGRARTTHDAAIAARIAADAEQGRAYPGDVLLIADDTTALAAWNQTPAEGWGVSPDPWQLWALLSRFGTAAIPGCVTAGARHPEIVRSLGGVASARLAPVAAAALSRRSARSDARRWLARHAELAAAGLLPPALGAGDARRDAALALRWLAFQGHQLTVREAARARGPEALAATEALLAFDPELDVPARAPKLPAFWDPASLPRPRLRDGRTLPIKAMQHLGELLASSPASPPSPLLMQVREALDPSSVDELAQALCAAWIAAGAPASGEWALAAVAHLGGDGSARWIAGRIPGWVEERSRARVITALEVLAAIGTDVALLSLGRLARSARMQWLKDQAATTLAEVASRRGLSPDEMDDRTVPDLGLDARGSRLLDFGTRTFRVTLDEHLRPVLSDEAGRRLRALPRPTRTDDAARAAEATRSHRALRDDADRIATLLLARFERAMCDRRRWTPPDFTTFLVSHPFVGRLVQRLVWAAYTEGELTATFRVTEEADFADPDDRTWSLSETMRVGVAHPLELGDELLQRWAGVLSDYRIVQPFAQLARATFTATPAERQSDRLLRLEGGRVWGGRLFALRNRGWRAEGDGLTLSSFRREVLPARADGRTYQVRATFHPGLDPSDRELGEHSLVTVVVVAAEGAAVWSDVDPVAFSEVVAELSPR
jgi:hypothetical protein